MSIKYIMMVGAVVALARTMLLANCPGVNFFCALVCLVFAYVFAKIEAD